MGREEGLFAEEVNPLARQRRGPLPDPNSPSQIERDFKPMDFKDFMSQVRELPARRREKVMKIISQANYENLEEKMEEAAAVAKISTDEEEAPVRESSTGRNRRERSGTTRE